MTMEEFNNNMTIVYSKTTGSIKGLFSGIQDILTLYGAEGEDYALIWDKLVLPKDDYVINNIQNFKVNTDLQKLELVAASQLSKYM